MERSSDPLRDSLERGRPRGPAALKASIGLTTAAGITCLSPANPVQVVVLSTVFALVVAAVFGRRELRDNVYRLLRFATDRPEPPAPPSEAASCVLERVEPPLLTCARKGLATSMPREGTDALGTATVSLPAPMRSGLVGYACLATGADGHGPLGLLGDAGCARIYADIAAASSDRPRMRECLDSLEPGDILTVTGLDQLGRSQRELLAVVEEVRRRGAGLRSLREDLDTTAADGHAIFRAFAGLAGLGRAAPSTRASTGLAAARARGTRPGRPPALSPGQPRKVRELLERPESTVSGVARQIGVSRSTLREYPPEALRAGEAPGRAAAHLTPYQARPGRRTLVIDDLADLRGPVTGRIRLPLRLYWTLRDFRFDLTDPQTRVLYYETVLREASRPEDLADHLHGPTLLSLWPELYLPKGVKRAWEEAHPSLRAEARANAAQRVAPTSPRPGSVITSCPSTARQLRQHADAAPEDARVMRW